MHLWRTFTKLSKQVIVAGVAKNVPQISGASCEIDSDADIGAVLHHAFASGIHQADDRGAQDVDGYASYGHEQSQRESIEKRIHHQILC